MKAKYFEQFLTIGGAGNCGINDMVERNSEEGDIVPINPIEEKTIKLLNRRKLWRKAERKCLM